MNRFILLSLFLATAALAQVINLSSNPGQTTADMLAARMNQELVRRVEEHKKLRDLLWNNPFGATPQQVLAALGTNAGRLFALSAENIRHVTACAQITGKTAADFGLTAEMSETPNAPNGNPWLVTINNDGTVTISEQ